MDGHRMIFNHVRVSCEERGSWKKK